jgi:hypothetical protein
MKKCAEFSKEATPEVTKEEPIPEKLEEEHIKSRTTPSVDFAASNEANKRSMSSAKPLRAFEPMDWVPIDYGEVFGKRRPFPNQNGMARALEVDFPPEKKAEDSYDIVLCINSPCSLCSVCSCATFEFLALDSTSPNNKTIGINTLWAV